ncbi:hypothetical protein JW824_07360 [bacterium]|nr:hypothetical protein [bacterium]RQV95136.1 MAG: hypothetical protein EH221_06725 [bacterium]
MNEQIYKLLITVLGALIPGLFGLINTIITLRSKREQAIIQHTDHSKPKPTKPISRKGRPRLLLFVVLIAMGAAFGYYIGNRTEKNPNIVKLYSQEDQRAIANERMMDIELQIREIDQEKARILEQPEMPVPEKEERIRNLDERIDQLMMDRARFEEIAR